MSKSRDELLQSLLERMGHVMRGVHMGHALHLGGFGIGGPQVRTIFKLWRRPDGMSVKELAEALSVTPGAVTQFIDPLVEKDLVSREEDTSDRRLMRIKLTRFARGNFEEFKRSYFSMVQRTFEPLTDSEIQQLITLLEKTNTAAAQKEYDR